jgi:hypothetical protein
MSDWFDGAGNGAQVDIAECIDGLGAQGVRELVEAGALVSLGTTSDGGALGVTVTVDGRWRREYFRDRDSLLAWIAEAIPAVEAARHSGPSRNGQSASGGNGQRSRRRQGL